MLASPKLAAAFIGIFVVGGGVGALITQYFEDKQLSTFFQHTSDPDGWVAHINDKYTKQYDLTVDEQNQIKPLTKEMAQHLYQLRRQFGLDVIAALDDYHEKVAAQMTPEQRAAYEADNLARKKRMTGMLLFDESSPEQGQK
jgi:hypothetical protein